MKFDAAGNDLSRPAPERALLASSRFHTRARRNLHPRSCASPLERPNGAFGPAQIRQGGSPEPAVAMSPMVGCASIRDSQPIGANFPGRMPVGLTFRQVLGQCRAAHDGPARPCQEGAAGSSNRPRQLYPRNPARRRTRWATILSAVHQVVATHYPSLVPRGEFSAKGVMQTTQPPDPT